MSQAPEASPSDSPNLEDVLITFRQSFTEVGLVHGIIVDLRLRADRMKPMLGDEPLALRPKLDLAIALPTDQQS